MFGARAENPSRASHFANAARRFALDAKMFRCRAAVHVENKDDIAFWGAVDTNEEIGTQEIKIFQTLGNSTSLPSIFVP